MRLTPSELARSALEAAPDAMIIIDASGSIRFVNRQVSALFGYEHDEIIGKSIEHLMPERFRARHVGHRDQYTGNVRLRPMGADLDLYARRKDGSEFPVEVSLSPIQDGDYVLVAAAIRDITDRNRVKAELIVARESRRTRHVTWPTRLGKLPTKRARLPIAPIGARVDSSPPRAMTCASLCRCLRF
jgi:PAS domain S-box-containing protein